MEDRDRDERRIVAFRKTLESFADANRRDQGAQSQQEHAEAVLEAEALRRVAWAVTSDRVAWAVTSDRVAWAVTSDEDDEPATG